MPTPDLIAELLVQARAARSRSALAEGRALAERAWRFAQTTGIAEQQAEAAYLQCFFGFRMGAMAAVLSSGQQALGLLRAPEQRTQRSELLRWMTLAGCEIGRFDQALACAREACELAEESADTSQRALALSALAACFERMGDPWQALRLLEQSLQMVRESGSTYDRFVILNNLTAAGIGAFYLLRGSDDADGEAEAQEAMRRARDFAREALPLAAQLGEPVFAVGAQGNLGETLLHLGELDEAARMLYGAQAEALEHGFESMAWRIRCSIGELLIEQGLAEQARVALEALLVDLQPGDPRATLIRVRHALYRACRQLGRHEEALRHLERHQQLERHRSTRQLKAQSRLLVTRVEAEQSRLQAERARVEAQLQRTRAAEFEAHALRDQLTGLGNRRHLDRELPIVLEAASALALPMTLALIDVDHFKLVNDRFGHAVGDQVLVALAQMLRDKTRGSDLLARIGGEEFLVALPDTPPERAAEVCERLRHAVECYPWDVLAEGLAVTLSVGVANAPPYNSQALFELADAAMYRAKQGGRNRVATN
jgi:diguanylate cyclase (GGDEF)-like protein